MNRQIGFHYQEASRFALEERMHLLEARVAALSEAVSVLVRGLATSPLAEPGDRAAAEAARQAHDLLLAARRPGPPAAPAPPEEEPAAARGPGPAAAEAGDR